MMYGTPRNSQAIIDKANTLWDNLVEKSGQDGPDIYDNGLRISKDDFFDSIQAIIDELHGVTLCVGNGLTVYGDYESISRTQTYVLLDTQHPIEKEDVKRALGRALQAIERAQGAPVGTLHEVKKS